MKHANIALFVANIGCPNMCTFCNQHTISGAVATAMPEDVEKAIKTAKDSGLENGQLAFFGGSFTAIDPSYMRSLLLAAQPFIKDGSISGIRISTRPDAISEDILSVLKEYGVTAIELGAQSMVEEVLIANRRGHTPATVREASALIRDFGFELGLQMMTGLYKDSDEGALYTAEELIKLNPDTIRIYPTVVLEGTELADLYRQGKYQPQTLKEATTLCAKLIPMFEEKGISIIRVGLHSGGNVEEGYIAGAYHPAFRELCESEIYLSRFLDRLEGMTSGKYNLRVASSELSKAIGQKRKNIKELENKGFFCTICADSTLKKYDFIIEEEQR